jgi:hypothetical protein
MPNTTFGFNSQFDAAVFSAEQQRQAAAAATISAYTSEQGPQIIADLTARQKAADIAYFRAVKAAAVASGASPSAAISALIALGTGGL